MPFPPSVDYLVLPRGRRHRHTHQDSEDQENQETEKNGQADHAIGVVGVGGPVVEFGRLGGVTLEKHRGGWSWVWAGEQRFGSRWTVGDHLECIYPGMRFQDDSFQSGLPLEDIIESSVQYAEQICLPYERDGLRDAISDILNSEYSTAGPSGTSKQPAGPQPVERDMSRGMTTAVICNARGKKSRNWVAYPTGEVGHQLHVTALVSNSTSRLDRRSRYHFAPTAKPADTFPTPILQICSAGIISTSRADRDATILLVRVRTTTHLISLQPSSTSPTYLTASRAFQVSCADTESRRHVDAVKDPEAWARVLLVDEGGGVWLWWEEKEVKNGRIEKVMNLRKIRDKVTNEKNQFFRIAFGTVPGTALVISSTSLTLIDIDDPKHPATILLTLPGPARQFTSIEKTSVERRSKWVLVCTTDEVIWIDDKGTIGLGWKHGYGVADVEMLMLPRLRKGEQSVLLYSPSSSLYTVLTTPSCKSGAAPRSVSPAYTLALPVQQGVALTDLAVLTVNSIHHPSSIIALSQDGSLLSIPLFHPSISIPQTEESGTEKRKGLRPLNARWEEDVQSLSGQAKCEMGKGEGWEEKASVPWTAAGMRWVLDVLGDERLLDLLDADQDDYEEEDVEDEIGEVLLQEEEWTDEEDVGETGGIDDAENRDYIGEDGDRPTESAQNPRDEDGATCQFDDGYESCEGEGTKQYLIPSEFEKYLRELEAPMTGLFTAAELARDSLSTQPVGSGTFATVPIHSHTAQPTLSALQQVDLSKNVTLATRLSANLPAIYCARPPLRLSGGPEELYNDLMAHFPSESRRDRAATAQLAADLYLSSMVFAPEDSLPISKSTHDRLLDQREEEERDGEEDFLRAARALTLEDDGPPLIEFNVVKPFAQALTEWKDSDDEEEEAQVNERKQMEEQIQTKTARALLSDWEAGSSPIGWTWQPVGKASEAAPVPSQQAHLPSQKEDRLIRPLPSSRSQPFLSQRPRNPGSPVSPRPPQAFHRLVPPTLSTSYSMPTLVPLTLDRRREARSSPPATDSQMGISTSQPGQSESQEGNAWASTQVERGRFGGRDGGREKKKKAKKRLGGF